MITQVVIFLGIFGTLLAMTAAICLAMVPGVKNGFYESYDEEFLWRDYPDYKEENV